MGYLYGLFQEIPFEQYRISPIGIAESKYSKKKRLIVNYQHHTMMKTTLA